MSTYLSYDTLSFTYPQSKQDIYPYENLNERIVLSKKFIDKHYHQNIKLDDIARCAFLSKFHFIRLFKLSFGVTPHQYVRVLKVSKAKSLLVSGISVKDTCIKIGFESPTSFTGIFKKYTGQTPSAYQKQKQF